MRVDGLAEFGQVSVEFFETTGGETARAPLAVDAPNDEARVLEQLEVPRNSRLRDGQRLRQLADRRFTTCQPQQDRPTGRIRKSGKSDI